jgi:poly-beta-1,6-N-acetyl-D-glucosamine biosynthesis protein PgaD
MIRRRKSKPSIWRLATEFTVTTLFWLAWLYLIMPLVSLLLWALGVQLFVDEMLVRGGFEALIGELAHYSLVILAMLFVTIVWVYWNLRHYGGHEQRTRQPISVSLEEIATNSGLSTSEILDIRTNRRLHITFDDDDHLVILPASGEL